MIKLTDYDTGQPVYVNETVIEAIRTLEPFGQFQERTQILMSVGIILVRETPDDVITSPPIK